MKCSKILATIAIASFFAANSFAAEEQIIGEYGAITIKKVTNNAGVERTVAYIDDESKVTPVISEDIAVDSVFFTRKFKQGTVSTLMLPFGLGDISPDWKLGLTLYKEFEVRSDCPSCAPAVYYKQDTDGKLEANVPYIVSSPTQDHQITFNTDYTSVAKINLNTTTGTKSREEQFGPYVLSFKGTYESIEFKNPAGIYGMSAMDYVNVKTGKEVKVGDFVHASCSESKCASVRPFRAYLKVTLASLNKSASDEELPQKIAVYLIDADGKGTTYVGQMNTLTGEIVKEDNRWFDMKGRVLDHKPTTKGTYYNNKKKVTIK